MQKFYLDERALNRAKPGKPLNVYKKQENLNLCINSAKGIGCTVVNIGAKDIMEKNKVLIFALVWQIIRVCYSTPYSQYLSILVEKSYPQN